MSSDVHILHRLRKRIAKDFRVTMEDDRCVALDLTEDPCGGLIRSHTPAEKDEILRLICRLTGLKELNLRRNKLGHLPSTFRDLTQLEYLNLGSNYLGEVPESLRSLTRLKYLHLANNDLVQLPGFIKEFSGLEHLALHKNVRLKSIDAVSGLKQLKILNLYYLNLHRLPPFIFEMEELVTLTVWNISEFPEALANLTHLEFFTNCGTPAWRTLPPELTQLRKMRMMRLCQNGLTCLPESFGALENLEQLSLYQNALSQLPESFSQLKNLKKLNLGWNCFRSIPACLGECSALEWLGAFRTRSRTHTRRRCHPAPR